MRKELFDKLSKKQQEEYKTKVDKIKSSYFGSIGITFCNLCPYFVALLVLAVPLWFMAFEIRHPEILIAGVNLLFVVAKVILYCVIYGFIIDYILFLVRMIRISNLKKDYFTVEAKKK